MSRNLKIKWKKKISVLLLTAMFAGCGIFSPQLRADATEETSASVTNEYMSDISQYRQTGGYTCPSKDGYVFGGWYSDETLNTPLATTQTTGAAYAKYVPADVLSVKFQSTMAGGILSDKDLRFVTTTDSLKYSSVGFEVQKVGSENVFTKNSSTVYSTIKGNDETYTPSKAFHSTSQYFMTMCFTDIPGAKFEDQLTVTPYWITLDGTKVTGVARKEKIWDVVNQNGNIVANYHYSGNLSPIGGNGTAHEFVEEFAGEKGCMKLTTSDVWPQVEFVAKHKIQSYKDAGYKYIVFRMYFPESGATWQSLTYGSPSGTKASAGKLVKGEWKDYYVSADAFFANWTDSGFINNARIYSGESQAGAVAYISEIRMEKISNVLYDGSQSAYNNTCYFATPSAQSPEWVNFENETCVKVTYSYTAWPKLTVAKSSTTYKNNGYKYIVFRMYFPEEGYTASSMRLISDTNMQSDRIATEKGQWKDYYFPASVFYSNTNKNEVKLDFAGIYDGNTEVNGAVIYLSEIRMEYMKPNN